MYRSLEINAIGGIACSEVRAHFVYDEAIQPIEPLISKAHVQDKEDIHESYDCPNKESTKCAVD